MTTFLSNSYKKIEAASFNQESYDFGILYSTTVSLNFKVILNFKKYFFRILNILLE